MQVYENGQSENPQVFYFNLREAVKGIKNDIDKILVRVSTIVHIAVTATYTDLSLQTKGEWRGISGWF